MWERVGAGRRRVGGRAREAQRDVVSNERTKGGRGGSWGQDQTKEYIAHMTRDPESDSASLKGGARGEAAHAAPLGRTSAPLCVFASP